MWPIGLEIRTVCKFIAVEDARAALQRKGREFSLFLSICPYQPDGGGETETEGPRLACRSRSTLAHQHPPVLVLAAQAGNGQMDGTIDTFAYAVTVLHRVRVLVVEHAHPTVSRSYQPILESTY